MNLVRKMLWSAIGAAALAVPAVAQAPSALSSLQPGMWQLRSTGGSGAGRSICIRTAEQLLQIQHQTRNCQRRTLGSTSNSVTVRYECGGGVWGQTQLNVETPRLARIDTQGISGGAPFHNYYEARRTGACG